MHDIEFRGKRIDNGEWVEGYYYKAKYYRTDDELCDYITVPHPKEYNEPSSHYIVNAETVGQYTGLKDKNGTKIFEGDIVLLKGDEEPYQVAFDESCFQVYGNSICYVMDNFYDHDIEVIGNIYDNPELLDGYGSA